MSSTLVLEQEILKIKELINKPLLLELIDDIIYLTELIKKYKESKAKIQFKIPRYLDLISDIGLPIFNN